MIKIECKDRHHHNALGQSKNGVRQQLKKLQTASYSLHKTTRISEFFGLKVLYGLSVVKMWGMMEVSTG